SSLGILRDVEGKGVAASFAALPPEVKAYARRPELLVVTKSTSRSTVHRPGYLDYIAVKRFNANGEVCGEDRFLGLFTSIAYSANPSEIPLLRRKTANIMARSGVAPGGGFPALGRRSEDGAGRRVRRSARQRTVQAIRARISRRIPGGFFRARCGSRYRADGGADCRATAGHVSISPT